MSSEYAFLAEQGEVLNIVRSECTLAEMQEKYPDQQVTPLGQVTFGALRKYRHWSERP